MGPTYSEKWFDLNGRTTATMVVGIGKSSQCLLRRLLRSRSSQSGRKCVGATLEPVAGNHETIRASVVTILSIRS